MTARPSAQERTRPERPREVCVVLDANALFLPMRTSLRIEEAIARAIGPARLVVPGSVRAELERLRTRGVPEAEAAIRLARRYPVARVRQRGDAGVLEAARRLDAWLMTADRELRERSVGLGIPVLAPRDRSGVERFPAGPRKTVKNAGPLRRRRSDRGGNDDGRRPIARPSEPRVRQRRHRRL